MLAMLQVKLTEVSQEALDAGFACFQQHREGSIWAFAVATDVLQLLPPDRGEEEVDQPR